MHESRPREANRAFIHFLFLLPAAGLVTVIILAAMGQPSARSTCLMPTDSSQIRGIIQANILWAQDNQSDNENSASAVIDTDQTPP